MIYYCYYFFVRSGDFRLFDNRAFEIINSSVDYSFSVLLSGYTAVVWFIDRNIDGTLNFLNTAAGYVAGNYEALKLTVPAISIVLSAFICIVVFNSFWRKSAVLAVLVPLGVLSVTAVALYMWYLTVADTDATNILKAFQDISEQISPLETLVEN